MDAAGKKKAEAMAKGLRAQGGTALCQGLVDGVNMMRKRTIKNDIASVMILTDSHFGIGHQCECPERKSAVGARWI